MREPASESDGVTTVSSALEWPDRRASSSRWLISPAGDFWLVCAGGGSLLVLMAILLQWHGDRELDTADLLLSELHLGATYDAIVRGRLWRRMPVDVLAVPLAIVALTYALMMTGQSLAVTTALLHLGAWHRGRQNFGIARFYQVRVGGAVSRWHRWLFKLAIYVPMAAGVIYFTSTSLLHEGEPYLGLEFDAGFTAKLGAVAAASLAVYLVYGLRHRRRIHPGECWLVIANALAFGSAYVLGAWSVSFILVLAVHHEVQYLYFTYAMARRSPAARPTDIPGEMRLLASFAIWPLIGLGSWAVCQLFESPWLPPFLVGGLLCHYWLDGRIWTSRARRLAAA
jgi:hypothetical protein